MHSKDEATNICKTAHEHLQSALMQWQMSALAEIGAFVLAHASLDAEQFSRQLRSLKAWKMICSIEEKEQKNDGAARSK